MSISELIKHVGDENIKVQSLSDCLVGANTNKKHITKITFATKEISANDLIFPDACKSVALIVWLPKDRLPK